MRGNPENLRAAARRKHDAAMQRAEAALHKLQANGDAITFRGLAKAAGVSVDFLYRSPLRSRIEQLRAERQHQPRSPAPVDTGQPTSQSSVVRALTAQLSELKQRHRAEVTRLEGALAAAQGENLELRRHGRLAASVPQ
jgi:Family of unknown function (DUF6262)